MLVSEVVPCADFVFNISIESGAKSFICPGWDMMLAVGCDCCVQIFYGCVYKSVVVQFDFCWGVVYVLCKVFPICLFL